MAEPWATGRGAFGLELGALRQGQKSWPSLVLWTLRLVPQCPHSRRPQVIVQRVEGDQVASKSSFDRLDGVC